RSDRKALLHFTAPYPDTALEVVTSRSMTQRYAMPRMRAASYSGSSPDRTEPSSIPARSVRAMAASRSSSGAVTRSLGTDDGPTASKLTTRNTRNRMGSSMMDAQPVEHAQQPGQ